MLNTIKEILNNEGINRIGVIDITECEIINARLLPKDAQSVIMFSIPYRSAKQFANDGFSEYARTYDYHKFSKDLFDNIINSIKDKTQHNFYGFCDHSPINEKLAAAKCGLGVIGKNSLFIDGVYGSFVFLGTLISNAPFKTELHTIKHCIGCNKCMLACPTNAISDTQGIDRNKCLSGISQKKKKNEDEKALLKKHNIIWGCDICQIICPYNENAKISPIAYFKKTRTENMDKAFILSLTDDEFNNYAFSYRGRQTVLDNMD